MCVMEIPIPLFQGGMAVRISLASLVSAVSKSGGLGILGASGIDLDELRSEIRQIKSEVKNLPFAVNIMVALSKFSDLVKVCVDEKVPAIVVGAGFSREIFKVREYGLKVIPIVSSLKAALISEKLGADAVILESGRAGGHLGTDEPLENIAEAIIESLSIPVIVAGGVETPESAVRYMEKGAAGIQLGTRFALSEESNFHQDTKKFLMEVNQEDIHIIDSPAGLPAQAIRSPLLEKVNSGQRPDPVYVKKCMSCLKKCSKRFCLIDALICAQKGDLENGLFFTGDQLPRIKEIKSAAEIVDEYSKFLKDGLVI